MTIKKKKKPAPAAVKKKPAAAAAKKKPTPPKELKPTPTAKAASDLLRTYRMQLLWPTREPKKARSHPGLYLAGVTAKMANDILADELVFMPAPRMTSADIDRIKRKKELSRRWAGSAHHNTVGTSFDD